MRFVYRGITQWEAAVESKVAEASEYKLTVNLHHWDSQLIGL